MTVAILPLVSANSKGSTAATKRAVRGVNPTTSTEREYTAQEVQYMDACRSYMKTNDRRFMTFSEYLAVARSIGYQQIGLSS